METKFKFNLRSTFIENLIFNVTLEGLSCNSRCA